LYVHPMFKIIPILLLNSNFLMCKLRPLSHFYALHNWIGSLFTRTKTYFHLKSGITLKCGLIQNISWHRYLNVFMCYVFLNASEVLKQSHVTDLWMFELRILEEKIW